MPVQSAAVVHSGICSVPVVPALGHEAVSDTGHAAFVVQTLETDSTHSEIFAPGSSSAVAQQVGVAPLQSVAFAQWMMSAGLHVARQLTDLVEMSMQQDRSAAQGAVGQPLGEPASAGGGV